MANKAINNDSLHTVEYISDIYIKEPKRALSLLDEAETGNLIPLNLIDELRSKAYRNMYMNKLAFLYAKKSYMNDSISQKDPQHLLKMTIDLAELLILLSENDESMRYALKGLALAKKEKDKGAESRLLFCIGENKRILSFKDEGYDFFDQAIELLSDTEDIQEMKMLSYFYGTKMGYLMNDDRNKEALLIGLKREKLIEKMKALPKIPDGYIDWQHAYLYAKLAYLCYLDKDYKRADEYYQRYLSTDASRTPDGKFFSTPYLMASKQYGKVIDNCNTFRPVMQQQDTLNFQYLSILQQEADAYWGLNDYKKVAELRGVIIDIARGINEKNKQNAALELDKIYEVTQKKELIAEQDFQLKIRNISLAFLTCIVFLSLFMLWRMWRYNSQINYKNKMLAKFINEKLSHTKMNNAKLFDNTDIMDSAPFVQEEKIFVDTDPVLKDEEDCTNEEIKENKILFDELNRTIIRDRLYLSPELSRDDLVRIVHLNNARFARMIKENTGTNLNGYINDLRIGHAIELLKKYPNYTIHAIAEEVGFNSTPVLYNLFKKKTGMTPNEFKKTFE
nr:AraC family transcriptional regulator [Parabacteroides bouchesdurhonensis]